jgi:uncharacterized membrane-anchored protein
MRAVILCGTLFLVLGTVNGLILAKERTLAEGTSILLRLAPVDSRPPMRDDHMALRYRLTRQIPAAALESSGHLVVALDGSGVASFRRLHRGEALLSDEHLLFYRKRGGLHLGADAFLPGRDEAGRCAEAAYAELKVDREGRSVLVGLRNAELRLLCE